MYTANQSLRIETEDIVTDCPLFKGLRADQAVKVLNELGCKREVWPQGSIIRIQGTVQEAWGIVVQGDLELSVKDDNGICQTMGGLSRGDIFGVLTALGGGQDWPQQIEAASDCTVLFVPVYTGNGRLNISGNQGELCLDRDCPKEAWNRMIENLLRYVAAEALQLQQRLDLLTVNGMRARLSRFFLQQIELGGRHTFTLDMNREGMARYLNVSRPSMSRELSRMKEEGLLDYYRNSFTIYKAEDLKKYCA
ncbi:Crp/Fnr family transcriptional regulator [Oscillospiraceae bacterium HV4-5-C5C]|nr:Crp/Fnr family transcriptional regulator [Oscillospiraceae bacterium HV4-5-C5C]